MGLWDALRGLAGGGIFTKAGGNFLTGTPERTESNLLPEQESLFNQQQQAAQGPGAGGAYGNAADYYYNNLSNDPETMKMLAAPEMRRFNEETIPGLSEQFAGMGSGGLSSSGFRNAAVNAGTDLSERLGAIRASLRENAAQGLMSLGQQGLQDRKVIRPGTPGLLEQIGPAAVSSGIGYMTGGPAGAATGALQSFNQSRPISSKGQSSWTGRRPLPNFMDRG